MPEEVGGYEKVLWRYLFLYESMDQQFQQFGYPDTLMVTHLFLRNVKNCKKIFKKMLRHFLQSLQSWEGTEQKCFYLQI